MNTMEIWKVICQESEINFGFQSGSFFSISHLAGPFHSKPSNHVYVAPFVKVCISLLPCSPPSSLYSFSCFFSSLSPPP